MLRGVMAHHDMTRRRLSARPVPWSALVTFCWMSWGSSLAPFSTWTWKTLCTWLLSVVTAAVVICTQQVGQFTMATSLLDMFEEVGRGGGGGGMHGTQAWICTELSFSAIACMHPSQGADGHSCTLHVPLACVHPVTTCVAM